MQVLLWTAIALVLAGTVVMILTSGDNEAADLTAEQRTMIRKLESVLLHDTTRPQYARVVNQFDHRGYVAGIADFATADGSAERLVRVYTARVSPNLLNREYGPTLRALAEARSDAVDGLAGFTEAWRTVSADPVFRRAQEDLLQTEYFEPAYDLARSAGLTTPLGVAVMFDSILQHGNRDDDPDGLPRLIERTNSEFGGGPDVKFERDWLRTFLAVREELVLAPNLPAHQELWPFSVGRVRALLDLLDRGAQQLTPPLTVNPYGTPHVLDLTSVEPDLSLPPGPSPAPPPTFPHLEGAIVGLEGLCLDLNGAAPKAGNFIKTYGCNFTPAQLFTAETDGTLRVVGMCLQALAGSRLPGAEVEIQPCGAASAVQQWRFGGGQLANGHSGLCLTVPADTTEPGIRVIMTHCTSAAGQRWAPPG